MRLRLKRRVFCDGDEGNEEIDKEAGRIIDIERVSEFQASS